MVVVVFQLSIPVMLNESCSPMGLVHLFPLIPKGDCSKGEPADDLQPRAHIIINYVCYLSDQRASC